MKDFGRWFQEQKPTAPAVELTEPDLPDGVYLLNGKFTATCRSCERDYEIGCDPSEFSDDMSYCGGSPRCIP